MAGCMQNGIAAGQQLLALSKTRDQKCWTLDPEGIEEHKWIRAGSFAWDTLDVSGNEDLELVLSQPAGSTSLLGEAECTIVWRAYTEHLNQYSASTLKSTPQAAVLALFVIVVFQI